MQSTDDAIRKAEIDRLNGKAWQLRDSEPRQAYLLAKEAFEKSFVANYSDGTEQGRYALAIIALDLDLHAEAYEYAFAAAEHYKRASDPVKEAVMQNVLGGVYYYIGDSTNRLKCNLRGLELCRMANDHRGLLRAMNNTADTYTRIGDYQKAMQLFEECLTLADDASPNIQCIVLSNMGEVKMLNTDNSAARKLIERSQSIGKRVDYREIVVSNYIMLAEMALGENQVELAEQTLNDAMSEVNHRISLKDRAQIHRLMADAAQRRSDFQKAFEHHRLFHRLEQEYLDGQKMREVRSIEFKNEMNALLNQANHLETMVEERTIQLENTLTALRIREMEREHDLEVEQAVNQFTQSLFLQNTVDEVLWDLAKNCISRLDFEDCVIYAVSDDGTELIQKAAYGPKNPIDLDIYNPMTIPMGKGIVGTVASSGKYELIEDTSVDDRYIVDDQVRLSEIAVPIMSEERVIGVIDSEHHQRGFFTEKHLHVLQTISSLVANRIDRIRALEQRESFQNQLIVQLRENEQLQTQVTRELEDKVAERTEEIEEARQRIEKQARNIRDSINYASYIQSSLLPSTEEVGRCFNDNFVLYLPRDVVSGDFYWTAQQHGRNYLAVADCTGHGVPGALLSVLCIEKMHQALLKVVEPADVLGEVNREVRKALRQHQPEAVHGTRDGMDIALISVDEATGKLAFAGAKRPLCMVRNGELQLVEPNRYSIGGHSTDDLQYEQSEMICQKGDGMYLFSDGFTDQFGGSDGKKYTSKRFRELLVSLASLPLKQQSIELHKQFHAWRGHHEQIDDVLVVGFRV